MIQRFVEMEEKLCSTIDFVDALLSTVSEKEWIVVKELCQILEPFINAKNWVSEENLYIENWNI